MTSRFKTRFPFAVVLTALMAISAIALGCGGAVEEPTLFATIAPTIDAGPPLPPTCSFPSDSYVFEYVELEGTCGPQVDSLFNPTALVTPNCTRGTFFDAESCDYTVTETCSSECDGVVTVITNKYELSLLGERKRGYLTRTRDLNGPASCTSRYQVTLR